MLIRSFNELDFDSLVELVAGFRQELAHIRKKIVETNLDAARAELVEYDQKGYPVYVAETEQGEVAGYLVCRVDGDVVWAESLYVLPQHRRKGIASALYAEAEKLAEELGNDTMYNWIDPTNTVIIQFLHKCGYNVLNLIELRRPGTDEVLTTTIQVGENEFTHY